MKDVEGLVTDWTFVKSRMVPALQWRRAVRAFRTSRPRPPFSVLKPAPSLKAWTVYFVFAPKGVISVSHRFTLERLRRNAGGLLVVCAAPSAAEVPASLAEYSDALIWKGLSGYDFSAYAIALRAIAEKSPGATTLVMNDSVLGPFTDLEPFISDPRWHLTGFTGSSLHENHLQSYAFVLRDVGPERLDRLDKVFPSDRAFDRSGDVVLCQELYFARVASQFMSVGAYWHAPSPAVPDPTLSKPLELLDAGFPFLKKSLLGKQSQFRGNSPEAIRARLQLEGHPIDIWAE